MARVLAVGGPKGGVGKTTVAVNIAVYACRLLGLRVLLVDADPNRSALDASLTAGELMPFEVAAGHDHEELVRLGRGSGYDVVIVDLPGARESGALTALLEGHGGSGPVVHGLLLPTRPELMDIRPLLRVVREEITPLGLAYLVALVRVHPSRVPAGMRRREELADMGLQVAHTLTRSLVAHDDALELGRPVMDLPGGQRSVASAADREYRALSAEALELVGIEPGRLAADTDKEQ